MRNVKNVSPVRDFENVDKSKKENISNGVNYWQVDHKVKDIFKLKEVIILSSPKAWEKYKWSRVWFKKKPKEGYFIWLKRQTDFPLATCITIASPKTSQNLQNLIIVEKGVKAKVNAACNATKNNLCGTHLAQGKIILKDNATLEYRNLHKWGQKDFVGTDYEFILGKDSKLIYSYKNLFSPKNLQMKTVIFSGKNSSSNLNFIINSLNSKIKVEDIIFLKGRDSQGVLRIRLVGRKKSKIEAISKIVAEAPSKGHLDCQGLLINKSANISLIPELVCRNKDAQLTHEASIGRISEEELVYLRMRGLSEKEAINLIVGGFLKL